MLSASVATEKMSVQVVGRTCATPEASCGHTNGSGVNGWGGKLRTRIVWLPIVDAFRTFVTCPPPVIRAVFQQIQTLTAPWSVADFRRNPPSALRHGPARSANR